MTIAEIRSDTFACPRCLWAKTYDGYVSVRPVVTENEAESINAPIVSYAPIIQGDMILCETSPAAPGPPARLWVKISDLQPELNGRRVGVIGQRRDEHGMPFVVKVEVDEDGKGLFEG